MSDASPSCRQLAAAIKNYLMVHREAADSEQGVADWWVPEMGLEASVNEVREALALLVQEGTVEMQTLVDGQLLYRAPRNRAGTVDG